MLDPIISWWHHSIIHFPNPPRDAAPYGLSEIDVPGHSTFGSAAGIGDVSGVLTRKFGSSTLVSIAAKAPTGNASSLIGSGAFDIGASAQYTYAINSRWQVLAQAGAVFQGKSTVLTGSRHWISQKALSVMYAHNSRDQYVFQWQGEESATVTGVEDSDAAHRVVTFGLQRKLSNSRTLSLYFTENGDFMPALAKVGPDFTIGAQVSTRF